MTNYKHIPVNPETYEKVREWQIQYFGTDSVPLGETIEALLTEVNNQTEE